MIDRDVLDELWARVEPTVYITREQFERALEGWDIEAVRIDGRVAFATLAKGPEFHYTSFNTGAPITLRMIRARLAPIIARHGFCITRTPKTGAERQHRFNRAFGFRAVDEDEHFIMYRMDECR